MSELDNSHVAGNPVRSTSTRIVFSVFVGMLMLVGIWMILGLLQTQSQWRFYGGNTGWYVVVPFVVAIATIFLSVFGLRKIWGLGRPTPTNGQDAKIASTLRGEVRGFHERTEQGPSGQYGSRAPTTIWTFRVERYQDGNRQSPIPVEMRSARFKGFINDGDTVELPNHWREGQLMRPKRIFNVTIGAEVKAVRQSIWGCILPFAIIGVVIALYVVATQIH